MPVLSNWGRDSFRPHNRLPEYSRLKLLQLPPSRATEKTKTVSSKNPFVLIAAIKGSGQKITELRCSAFSAFRGRDLCDLRHIRRWHAIHRAPRPGGPVASHGFRSASPPRLIIEPPVIIQMADLNGSAGRQLPGVVVRQVRCNGAQLLGLIRTEIFGEPV